MKKLLITALFVFFIKTSSYSQMPQAPYLLSNGNQTPTYNNVIEFYKQLQNYYPNIQIESKNYYTDVQENIFVIKLVVNFCFVLIFVEQLAISHPRPCQRTHTERQQK